MIPTTESNLVENAPTYLDPQESTMHPSHDTPPSTIWRYPNRPDSDGFNLKSEQARKQKKGTGSDQNSPCDQNKSIAERGVDPLNWHAGIAFRHKTWESDREKVLNVVVNEPMLNRAYWSLKACGTEPIVYQNPDDPSQFKVGSKRCHHRFCVPCAQDRARLIVANMHNQIPHEPTRFITLTLKHSDESLKYQLNRLYECFGKLRRRALWKRTINGGLAFTEIKLAKSDGRWHPHLHILTRGKYLPQGALSDAWLQITGDSHVVDIRMVKAEAGVYSYLTKYVTKGWGSGLYRNADRLHEAMVALKGRKVVMAFGTFAKINLLKPPEPQIWDVVGTLQEVIAKARTGDRLSCEIVKSLQTGTYVPPLEPIPPD